MISFYLACVVTGLELRVAPNADAVLMKDVTEEKASSEGNNSVLPACTSATATKPCICRGEATDAGNSTSANGPQECKVGETCVDGACNNPLQDIVPVVSTVDCPPKSLLQAAAKYRTDPKYLKSDADGNCLCPPNHVCVSTEILDRMNDLKKGLTGDPKAIETIDKLVQQQIFVIGCPARENDHVHWKTSRNKYSWRVTSAICREIPRNEQPGSEPEMEDLWKYVLLIGLVIMMLIILCISFRRGHTAPARRRTGRSDDEHFNASGRHQSPRDVCVSSDTQARPSTLHKTIPSPR